MFHRIAIALVVSIFATNALAAEPTVTFTDVVARPAPGKIGLAFFTATSTVDDSIISVASPCCKAVEIHRTEKLNGIMSMRRIAELSLKKKKPTLVQPESNGGEHMMLIGLTNPLVEGDELAVTFTFKKSPAQTVTFPVLPAKTDDAGHSHH